MASDDNCANVMKEDVNILRDGHAILSELVCSINDHSTPLYLAAINAFFGYLYDLNRSLVDLCCADQGVKRFSFSEYSWSADKVIKGPIRGGSASRCTTSAVQSYVFQFTARMDVVLTWSAVSSATHDTYIALSWSRVLCEVPVLKAAGRKGSLVGAVGHHSRCSDWLITSVSSALQACTHSEL